ncbi:cytochrome C [Shewanella sp. TC10]|uniref:Vgb family protein n=1 Tax=Shewanella sp. TC10 TaxID=1419739 RepID=UPI001E5CBF6B|nr:cytochrome C [Shewanella sp. TC10]
MFNQHITQDKTFLKLIAAATFLSSFSISANSAELPQEKGLELVETHCVACHSTRRISQSLGYSREDWQALTESMIDLSGAPEQRNSIINYLEKHFPPNNRRTPTILNGAVNISFQEWVVPTLGQRSRDPVAAADGSIWWAGQWGNLIGQINPVTNEMREYPLPPGSMPHSVTIDAKDHVWYTGNKNATIGKLNPQTGKIVVYDMPDSSAKDPHTAVFDANGILWFTLQHANRIGRLDPQTGDIKLVTLPTPSSRPYGIKIDASGHPWVACNGHNCLIKVNPETMSLSEIALPHKDTKVRRLDIDSEGMIWYVNSSRGRLGRYDPQTGKVNEWPTPSGSHSHPYAIAVVDGAIWFNESGMRPDPLVRFDPKTETFQSWEIPSGGFYAGIVRHMRPTSDGDLLIHQSATNRIIKVKIDTPAIDASLK